MGKAFRFWPFLVSLSAATCWAQIPDTNVTYSTVAVPVKRAVEEIAKLTGARIDVAKAASSEIVVIRVTEAPLKDVMAKLASVTSCEWTQDADGINWLNYSAAQTRKEADDAAAARAKAVADALKKLDETIKKQGEGQSEAKAGVGAGVGMAGLSLAATTSTPAGKALLKIAMKLGPEAFSTIGPSERTVFSSSPTRMQRGIGNISAIMSDLIRDHNAAAEKAKQAKAKEEVGSVEEQKAEAQMREMFGGLFALDREDKPITAPPAKVLVIATRGGPFSGMGMLGDSITLQLRVYDATGTIVAAGMQSLNIDSQSEDIVRTFTNPEAAPPATTGEEIRLSDLAKEFAGFANFNPMAGPIDKKPSDELLERLSHPDKYDPLSLAESEGLLGVAKAKAVNLIACVPDSVVSLMNAFSPKVKVTVDSVMSDLQSGRATTAELKDGWLTVRPSRPVESRKLRVDRRVLGDLIAAAIARELPSLEEYAAYALKNEQPTQTPIVMPYLIYFAPQTISQGMRGMTSWEMLRLYGELPESSRSILAQGGRLPFRSLLPSQAEQVRRMAFGASSRLIVESESSKPKEEGGFFDMIASFMPKPSKDYKDEPTEVMPNGLPPEGFIELKGLNDTLAMPVGLNNRNQRMWGTLGADEIAMLRYFSEEPQFAQVASMMPKLEQMRLGSRRELNFTFRVAPDVLFKQSLLDDRMTKDAPVVAMDALPGDFKSRIAKRLEALKKTPWPTFPGMGPPPPN
jgi:hypothetical protein